MRPFFCVDKAVDKSLSLLSVESEIKKQIETNWHERIFPTDLVLQSIAEGVCVIDQDEKIVFANFSAAKNFGYTPTEIIGKNYHELLFNRKKAEALFCPISFALTEGETSHVNTETFFRKDGSNFLVEYVCVPLIEREEIIGSVVTFEDITERRDIETAIAAARDTALENARARAAFLANMSHEIRTPLNGIIGTTDLLLNSNLDKEQKNYAEMLRTSADLLLEIVNEMLDFSKIEAGKLELETVEFDIRRVLKETTDLFSALAKKKNLALFVEIDERIPSALFGDSSQLRQVLNNLLSNAVKFTEAGQIAVQITLGKQTGDASVLLFEIFDSGIGIAEDAQKYIFEPFAQADISTTRRFGGTGLGLAICRRIVELMNGEIGLESQSGKGSRFWFTAKFAENGEDIQAETTKINEKNLKSEIWSSEPKITESRNLKVLIVEDNLINREITKALLKQIGIESENVENGLKAVEICRENHFDFVLMDCRMPEMDGFEATRKILGQTKSHQLPKIIALTASATAEEREKCFAAGMSDVLTKPFTQNDLINFLNKHWFKHNRSQNLDLEKDFVQHSFSDIIDPEILENFIEIEAGGEKNFVSDVFNLFCNYTESGISKIEKAFSEKNIEVIKQKAHDLRGSSANVGVKKLPELFENLESVANDGNWKRTGKIITEITEIFNHIKYIIEKNL